MLRLAVLALTILGLLAGAGQPARAALAPVGPNDLALGDKNAPVTIIEYASLGCIHCARWEKDVFPQVKADLIDTGKIRYVFRDYPLDNVSLRAAILARCAGPGREMGFIQVLFASQASWAPVRDPMIELAKIAKLGGIPDSQFQSCMTEGQPKFLELRNAVVASHQTGDDAGVDSTPSFFINGHLTSGEITYADFVALVKAASGS